MAGLILIVTGVVLGLLFPPLGFVLIPLVVLCVFAGLFFKSIAASIREPNGNDVKWAGERITRAIEPDPEEWNDDSISPALHAAQEEYAEEQTRKSTGAKKKLEITRKVKFTDGKTNTFLTYQEKNYHLINVGSLYIRQ